MVVPAMRPAWFPGSFGAIGVAVLVALTAGCGGNGNSGEPPTYESPTGPTLVLSELTGSWGGRIDTGRNVNMCWNLAWTTAQGVSATGRMEILAAGQPFVNPMVGTLTATATGSGYALTLSVPPFVPAGRPRNSDPCLMSGTGTVSTGRSPEKRELVMTGPVTLEWAPACAGIIYNPPTPNAQPGTLLLVKDEPIMISGGCY